MATVFEHVRLALMELVAIPEAEVVPGAHLVEDLGIDSQDFVRIILHLEEVYSQEGRIIEIADEELEGIETVQHVVSLLEGKLSAAGV